MSIECTWSVYATVRKFFAERSYVIMSSGGEYIPTNTVEITEFDKALKVHTLISTLEEDDDVESVWHNAIIAPEIITQITTHLESNRFRT